MELLQRVEQLEAKHRRYRFVLLSISTVAVVGALVGAGVQSHAIEAREFRLVDSKGIVRMRANAAESQSTLTLCDPSGRAQLIIYATGQSGDSSGGMLLKHNGQNEVEGTFG